MVVLESHPINSNYGNRYFNYTVQYLCWGD